MIYEFISQKRKEVSAIISRHEVYALFLLVALVFLYKLSWNYGLYPSVVDELTYSSNARLLPFSTATVPDYLYRYIYSYTKICNDGWMDCARLLNTLFFVFAAPPIYLITRRLVKPVVSLWVVFLALIGPVNSYTAYFMPESMYFSLFWWFSWIATKESKHKETRYALLAGSVLGAMTLVKPHAIFLIPAYLILTLFIGLYYKESLSKLIQIRVVPFLIILFAVKFAVSIYYSGMSGITLLGNAYSGIANNAYLESGFLEKSLPAFLTNILGHIQTVILMWALPIAGIFSFFLNANTVYKNRDKLFLTYCYSILVVVTLIAIVAAFTAIVSISDPTQVARLHLRYYGFALPLMIISVSALYSNDNEANFHYLGALIATLLSVLLCYSIVNHLKSFTPDYVDGPEIRGYVSDISIFYIFATLQLALLVLWVFKRRAAYIVFLFLFAPALVIITHHRINIEVNNRAHPSVFDKAAIFVKYYLSKRDVSELVIIAPPPALGIQTLSKIHLDDVGVGIISLNENAIINTFEIARKSKWILYVGTYQLDRPPLFKIESNGFTLAKFGEQNEVWLNREDWPGTISSIDGIGVAEPWGRWSNGKVVTFKFANPLPKFFTLHLRANAYGKNIGSEFTAKIGSNSKSFKVNAAMTDVDIELKNPQQVNEIEIHVPYTDNNTERGIGLGFEMLYIKSNLN